MTGFNEEINGEEHQEGGQWGPTSDHGEDPSAGPEFEPAEHYVNGPEPEEEINRRWNGTSAPKIENYETIEAYEQDLQRWESRQKLTPWADDPHGGQRRELTDWLQRCERGRALAEARGDTQGVRDWDGRAQLTASEINALPDPPQAEFIKAAETGRYQLAVDILVGQGDPIDLDFDDPRVQSDAAVVLVEANRRDGARVVLPIEDGPFGPLTPVSPQSVLAFELSPDEFERFEESVYQSGGDMDPDSILRRSWDTLRCMGVDTHGREPGQKQATPERGPDGRFVSSITSATPPIKPTDSTVIITKDPNDMTQKEYEAWRVAGGR